MSSWLLPSPTYRQASGGTPSPSHAARYMRGSGFFVPIREEKTVVSKSGAKAVSPHSVGTSMEQSDTSPSFRPDSRIAASVARVSPRGSR